MSLCEDLARWSRGAEWEALDAAAQASARRLLLAALGCAVGARRHPAALQAQEVAQRLSAAPFATWLGSVRRLPMPAANLDSGAAIRAPDLNEFYWGPGLGGHPSDLFAVALAAAEEVDACVDDLLAAVVAGYEVYHRLGDLMPVGGQRVWPWIVERCLGAHAHAPVRDVVAALASPV